MPIVFERSVGGSMLTLWQITESEEQLHELVTADDVRSANQFSNHNRRIEHLAGRAMVRMIASHTAPIIYSEVGAPMLSDGSLRLGLAHTEGVVALITNRANLPCAVDIESTKRSFSAASQRYISNTEAKLEDSSHPHFEAVMWCAKETMYKYAGRRELDLLKDIKVLELDIERGRVVGELGSVDSRRREAYGQREGAMESGQQRQVTGQEPKLKEMIAGGTPAANNTLRVETGDKKLCIYSASVADSASEADIGLRVDMGVLYYGDYIVVYTLLESPM